ncbi:bifunctional helix-turn-helix transcriptional regulator/GNAT family N-acetyltransferase [Microvirga puerhi]|uniref:Helix-turn-helix domain-containing GNAT family N-acetyltransferase n=1 Tax=Microvirga puerhi TaxID=2876078 RepID=A0ABS7VPC0_9HYPH|nr:bifunctional helix-turn-helix transcriptional regulator/GNAT family N-acetyltransferase [Microvirga puerhi]MBZ6077396.1 helix-turn-helix domain-containing GNAT family N-acetyltransferase [Microvirga puerhi]
MDAIAAEDRIAAIRRFTRFYTRRLGVLREGLLDSPFSLTEARVLYELAHRTDPTAGELCQDLDLDPGYLSRILKRFEEQRLVRRVRSASDGRQHHLVLTEKGKGAFAPLDRQSREQIATLLMPLSEADQRQLVANMRAIEKRLDSGTAQHDSFALRTHRPGDMGWVVHRHGALYAQEYGWDETFEALVAEIVAGFVKNFDPEKERCWLADRDGDILGSIFIVKQSDEIAKLRLLYVEAHARGLGVGKRLVDEAIRFSRERGYRQITLWTNDILHAARGIYTKAGFRLVSAEPHHSFGHDLVGENWVLDL